MFRYEKILVPLDGSKLAERALAPAVMIAQAMGSELLLLQVVTPLVMPVDPQFYEQLSQQGEDEAAAYLHRLQLELADTAVSITPIILKGPAGDSILHCALSQGCDLIVMSSHGRSGASRWVYGSVADKVLRGLSSHHSSVLIIRTQVEVDLFTYRHFLVPLDGSQLAAAALIPAAALAQQLNGRLSLLRVIHPAHLSLETDTMKKQSDYLETQDYAEGEAYLQQAAATLTANTRKETGMIKGPAADAIIDYAESHQIDLIIMSSHGRSGIARWIYGSVTEKVLRGANCATLVVHHQ